MGAAQIVGELGGLLTRQFKLARSDVTIFKSVGTAIQVCFHPVIRLLSKDVVWCTVIETHTSTRQVFALTELHIYAGYCDWQGGL
jgi:hypothetical protein